MPLQAVRREFTIDDWSVLIQEIAPPFKYFEVVAVGIDLDHGTFLAENTRTHEGIERRNLYRDSYALVPAVRIQGRTRR